MKHIYLIIIILTTLSVRGQDTLLLTSKCSYYESELSGSKTCYKYVYNDAGQLTISTFSIGKVEKIRTENIYNELGQKKIKIEFSQTDRTKKDTTFYTYKADTIYIKRNSFKQLYEVKYSLKGEFLGGWGGNFDQHGNLLSISKTVCEFDSLNGSRKYVVSYNSINDMLNNVTSDSEIIFDQYFKYDTSGRKIQEIFLIPVNSYKYFEYDKKGRLTKETTVKSKTENNKVLNDTITNLFIYKETGDSLYTTCQNSIFTNYHVKITPLHKIQSGPSYVLFFDKKGNEVILKRKVTTIYNELGYPIEQKVWSRPEEYYNEYSEKWTAEPTPLGIEITKFEYITISKNKMSDFNYNWDD